MYWTLQNLKDSERKEYVLHYGSVFSAATVGCHTVELFLLRVPTELPTKAENCLQSVKTTLYCFNVIFQTDAGHRHLALAHQMWRYRQHRISMGRHFYENAEIGSKA
jgi:hypothetical protein